MSNEWLTTGQMIDRLKVGDVAELKFDENVPYSKESAIEHYVTNQDGIRWCVDAEGKDVNGRFVLADCALNYKWRILPNYVSFEEAMKALKEGKTVSLRKVGNSLGNAEYNDKITYEEADKNALSYTKLNGHSLLQLVDGAWSIEDDTNA